MKEQNDIVTSIANADVNTKYRINGRKLSYVNDLHLLFVVHVVDSQTSLVDEVIQRRIFLY